MINPVFCRKDSSLLLCGSQCLHVLHLKSSEEGFSPELSPLTDFRLRYYPAVPVCPQLWHSEQEEMHACPIRP